MDKKTQKFKITKKMKEGVLLEDLDGKVDLVLENFVDVKKTLAKHTKILTNHTERFGKLETKLDFALETKADKKDLQKLTDRALAIENS